MTPEQVIEEMTKARVKRNPQQQREQQLLLDALQRLGHERRQHERDSRVLALRISELAQKALNAGVPLSRVASTVGVTRQTIYTLMAKR